MKSQYHLTKIRLLFLFSFLFFTNNSYSQKNGLIPLTGLRYYHEGIMIKDIQLNIDGAQLLSNRVPLNKEMELILHQPAGFTAMGSSVFAGAEVIVLSPRGEVLSTESNVLSKNQTTGFASSALNKFSIKFGIAAALIKANFNGTVKIRLYDLKSKNQLRMEMPVTFAKPGEPLQISKSAISLKMENGQTGFINGLKAKDMQVSVDTSIKISPKMAYTSLNIKNIEGSSISEIFNGKESFWVYDSDMNEVKISDILLKQVKGALENNMVDYTLKIPYRLKTLNKLYTVRFRWESFDKKQVIDVIVNI